MKAAIGVEPEEPGPAAAFHPWFRRDAFEDWVDRSAKDAASSRLCMVGGHPGTGKSFLASILRHRAPDGEPVVISATETTAWSWRDAIEKWGVDLTSAAGLRPEAGVAMHDEAPKAAYRVARYGGRHTSSKPLFVMIDFDGNASFVPGEEPPWLPFMSELLGYPWVRLVVVGAPELVALGLADQVQDDGGEFLRLRLEHVDAEGFRTFARHLLRKGRKSVPQPEVDEAMDTRARILNAFPAAPMQTVASVLAATLLRQSLGS